MSQPIFDPAACFTQTWDDTAREVSCLDETGTVISTRAYTASENENADRAVAAATVAANEATLHQQALTAMANNKTFLALTPPLTNPQVVAQVNALTRQVNALIRLATRSLDATS
jgi:hypothetical protein